MVEPVWRSMIDERRKEVLSSWHFNVALYSYEARREGGCMDIVSWLVAVVLPSIYIFFQSKLGNLEILHPDEVATSSSLSAVTASWQSSLHSSIWYPLLGRVSVSSLLRNSWVELCTGFPAERAPNTSQCGGTILQLSWFHHLPILTFHSP